MLESESECIKPGRYERPGYNRSSFKLCIEQNSQGCESQQDSNVGSVTIFPKCIPGYIGQGYACAPTCPSSMKEIKEKDSCQRDIYNRGKNMTDPKCPLEFSLEPEGYCQPRCRKRYASFENSSCWEKNCPPGMIDCGGALCTNTLQECQSINATAYGIVVKNMLKMADKRLFISKVTLEDVQERMKQPPASV